MKFPIPTLLLAGSFFLPFAPPAARQTLTPPSLISDVERSIVKIEYGNLGESHHVCTGFVISSSKGEALTAAHCVPGEEDEDKTLYVDGKVSEVVRNDGNFALIGVPKMEKPPLSIKKEEAKVGDEVWSFGYAWGKMTVLHRMIAGFLEKDVATDGPLAPGMSGGPTVNGQGEVIGINQASNNVIGLACGVEEMNKFLKSRASR